MGAGEAAFGSEITYFRKPDGRTVLFVCDNLETVGTELGGGNAVALQTNAVDITLAFTHPVRHLRDERRGADHGDGTHFAFTWRRNEALVLSFD